MRRSRAEYEKAPQEELTSGSPGRAPEAVTFLDHLERPERLFSANPGDVSHTAGASGAIDSEKTWL